MKLNNHLLEKLESNLALSKEATELFCELYGKENEFDDYTHEEELIGELYVALCIREKELQESVEIRKSLLADKEEKANDIRTNEATNRSL